MNFFGQVAELDPQGRVLIQPRLRESALMNGEVDVLGQQSFLEVWNHERLVARLSAEPFTDEDAQDALRLRNLVAWNRRTFRFSSTRCERSCSRSAAASSSIARSVSAGHSRMLLEGGASRLIGIDRDTDALAIARDGAQRSSAIA